MVSAKNLPPIYSIFDFFLLCKMLVADQASVQIQQNFYTT